MRHIAVIYEWPLSQQCCECQYGKLFDNPPMTAAFICTRYCLVNDGVDFPKKLSIPDATNVNQQEKI